MGSRTLKHVPLDFNWPLKKRWEGYLNPHRSEQCRPCKGIGYAPKALLIYEQWYGNAPFDPVAYGAKPLTVDHPGIQAFARRQIEQSPEYYGSGERAVQRNADRLWRLMRFQWSHHLIQADVDALVAEERLWDLTRVPLNKEQAEVARKKVEAGGNSWLPESNGHRPTADEVNAWSIGGMGHDGINMSICVRARCAREGVETRCAKCDGSGERWSSPELKKAHDEWKEQEPPEGPGYQLWETVSEGSPVSPVFGSLDELCAWAAENATTFADNKATAEQWKKMLDDGFVYHREGNNVFC